MALLKRSGLLAALYEENILLSSTALLDYTRGWKWLGRGYKKYFFFYPDVLPHEKGIRNRNEYDLDKVRAWIMKYKKDVLVVPEGLDRYL